ncbi:DUF302 domain-containing protein [Ahrensia sp. R2A130]|uniref:DUF302 domain-containing protein n=1 Tax=Ahrensia sp. R2A130 TaxID=744979 RepID=UPI0001E0843D|nr:DUF302 domain-containing protein [Ahrensia sp. R2A130]EFL88088.1 putative protein CrcB-like protein [Ahrensia sp. R2A130]
MKTTIKNGIAAIALAAAVTVTMPAPGFADGHASPFITQDSANSVAETADKLVAAIEKAGATVFAVVDHQANAAKAGLELPPTRLVIFGNPKIGTPIMQADRMAGIDLPVRVLIWAEDGKTKMAATSPDTYKQRYKVDAAEKPLTMMGGALGKLMGAAAQ